MTEQVRFGFLGLIAVGCTEIPITNDTQDTALTQSLVLESCDTSTLENPIEYETLDDALSRFETGVDNAVYIIGAGLNAAGVYHDSYASFKFNNPSHTSQTLGFSDKYSDYDPDYLTPVIFHDTTLYSGGIIATQCYMNSDVAIECHMANLFPGEGSEYTVGALLTPLNIDNEDSIPSVMLGSYFNLTNSSSGEYVDAAPNRVYINKTPVCRVDDHGSVYETCDLSCETTLDGIIHWLSHEGGDNYLVTK